MLGIEKRGAMAVLGEHYTPAAWQLIKVVLAKPGDPYDLITHAVRPLWPGSQDDMDLDLYAGVMLYMSSRDARVVRRSDRREAVAMLGALNRKKRRREHYQGL